MSTLQAKFENPDRGPGTPYLAANLLPAVPIAAIIALETGNPGSIDGSEFFIAFITYAPFIYLGSVIANSFPVFLALKVSKKLDKLSVHTAIAFGGSLALFWLLMFHLRAFGNTPWSMSQDFPLVSILSHVALVASGMGAGWLFWRMLEKQN